MAKKKAEKAEKAEAVDEPKVDHIENWSVFGAKMAIVDVHTHLGDNDKKLYQPAISILLDDFSDEEDTAENRKFISIVLDKIYKDVNEAIYTSVNCAMSMFDNVANKVNVYDVNHEMSKEYSVDKVFAKMEKASRNKYKSSVSFW